MDEIAGAAQALRQHMTPIRSARRDVLDTCGTGGDQSGTFNVSTAAVTANAPNPEGAVALIEWLATDSHQQFADANFEYPADPDVEPRATIHSNRKLPLLSEFPLKPGRITLCRITQGDGKLRMMLASGEMIAAIARSVNLGEGCPFEARRSSQGTSAQIPIMRPFSATATWGPSSPNTCAGVSRSI